MLRLFKRTKEVAVEFCERCSQVRDAGCRRAALRERALVELVLGHEALGVAYAVRALQTVL